MFEDAWGIGREGRSKRATALRCCQRCPVRRECGQAALDAFDAGQAIYGVVGGIEFTDVTPSRQVPDVERLRAVVVKLTQHVPDGPCNPYGNKVN
jgi:hypothetical protein